jgi:membrane associated rhomboid family serine protease
MGRRVCRRDLLIARGLLNPHAGELAIGAMVAVISGGVLLGGLEPQRGISRQGHRFGAIGGLLPASALARSRSLRGACRGRMSGSGT